MSSESPSDNSSGGGRETGLRVASHTRGAAVEFRFDGRAVAAYEGETVACALFAAGIRMLRRSPRTELARGMFCLMGSCQECVVWADGRRVAACQEPARAGLDVRSGTIERAP
jgi:predicted molibdopterin-dependent oxidoreductase YjgC